jgi:hypothetical protein
VAWEHRDVVAEPEKFLPDSAEQKIDISTGKVPPADAAGEKHVAADEQLFFAPEKTETPRAMAWHFQHLQLEAEKISHGRFGDCEISIRRFDFQFETESAKEIAIRNHRHGFGAATDLAIESPFDSGDILDVIDVAVREQKQLQIDTALFKPRTGAIGRVDQDRALWGAQEIAVRLENTATKALVAHWFLYFIGSGPKSASKSGVFRDF